jgi:hypothetical protein
MAVREPRRSTEAGPLLKPRELAGIGLLALVPSLIAAWAIPLGAGLPDRSCAPDEGAHMTYVNDLAGGRFATWPEIDSRMSMYLPSHYAAQVGGLVLARAGLDRPWQYRLPVLDERDRGFPLARAGSSALGALAVTALAAAAAHVTGSRAAGIAAGIVGALYPQRFFVAGYVNNDVATFAAGALLVLALARWLAAGEADRGVTFVGAASGAVLLAKASGYVLLPPTAAWLLWARLHGRASTRALLRGAIVSLAIAAPVLLWNALRTGGDPLGIALYHRFLASPAWRADGAYALPDDAALVFARALTRSSFMKFSNMSLALPVWLYLPWLASVPIGLGWAVARVRGATPAARRAASWVGAVAALALAAMVYECFWVDFSPQGRYVLLPVVILTAAAWIAPSLSGSGRGPLWTRLALAYLVVAAVWALWLLVQWPCGPEVTLPEPS